MTSEQGWYETLLPLFKKIKSEIKVFVGIGYIYIYVTWLQMRPQCVPRMYIVATAEIVHWLFLLFIGYYGDWLVT